MQELLFMLCNQQKMFNLLYSVFKCMILAGTVKLIAVM